MRFVVAFLNSICDPKSRKSTFQNVGDNKFVGGGAVRPNIANTPTSSPAGTQTCMVLAVHAYAEK